MGEEMVNFLKGLEEGERECECSSSGTKKGGARR
jgi:hypothetical protein